MALKRIFVLIAFAFYLLPNASAAQHTWALRNGALSFETGTFGKGQFLAIQNDWNYQSSTLFRSPDGLNWVTCSLPPHHLLTQVHYGNGLFVAVDSSGSVFTSDNAIHWSTPTNSPTVNGFIFKNGTWISHEKSTDAYYASQDFVNWTWLFQRGNHTFGVGQNGFIVASHGGISASTNGLSWYPVGMMPIPATRNIVEGNGIYVVQDASGVYASSNGTDWIRSNLPTGDPILFGNGHFVSYRGTTWDFGRQIFSSRDGVTWHSVGVPAIDAVIFNGEMFYGLGSHLAASPDGSTWTRRNGPPPSTWIDQLIPTTTGLYALGGVTAPLTLLHSADGRQWRELFPPWELSAITGIASHESTSVAVGSTGTIAVSSNNTSWIMPYNAAATLTRVTYANDQWIAVGHTATNGIVLSSSDAYTWNRTTVDRGFTSLAFGNGRFIGVDGTATMQISEDGRQWRAIAADQSPQIVDICFGNGVFLGFHPAIDALYRSSDGINWERLWNAPQFYFSSITFHDGKFALALDAHLAVTTANGDSFETSELFNRISPIYPRSSAVNWNGDLVYAYGGALYRSDSTNGFASQVESRPAFPYMQFCRDRFLAHSGLNIYSSRDGFSWEAASTPISDEAPGYFAYGHNRWIFFAAGGFAAFSDDANNWSAAAQDWNKMIYSKTFTSLTFGSDLFVAVGKGGIFATSTNGTSWTIGNPVVAWDLEAVAYGNGRFVVVGNSTNALTSTNGREWISVPTGRSNPSRVTSISFGHGQFVACTAAGEVLTSTTGTEWEVKVVEPDFQLLASGVADDGLYVGGVGGILYTSKDGRDWVRIPGAKGPITSISSGNGNLLISDGIVRQRTPSLQSTPTIDGSGITLSAVVEPGRPHKLISTADFEIWQTATNFTPAAPRHNIPLDVMTNQSFFKIVAE